VYFCFRESTQIFELIFNSIKKTFVDHSFFRAVRFHELQQAIQIISDFYPAQKGLRILEIGAGAGWQAALLSEQGHDVSAIELENSNYAQAREFQIMDYNGKEIPFSDNYFDVVFSSNVLEHIPHLEEFHAEMQRVMKPDGLAVHLMPSGTWSFWRLIVHYPAVVKMALDLLIQKIKSRKGDKDDSNYSFVHDKYEQLSIGKKLRKAIFPNRHGERGNVFSEVYYFSKMEWKKTFNKGGWEIIGYKPNGLFYTGHLIFGIFLSMSARKPLSSILGSSCHVFILKK
jgi:ubiquinone/menaquinone biosynthesis C-methylase UbiE